MVRPGVPSPSTRRAAPRIRQLTRSSRLHDRVIIYEDEVPIKDRKGIALESLTRSRPRAGLPKLFNLSAWPTDGGEDVIFGQHCRNPP
jgi:hypothetical protein